MRADGKAEHESGVHTCAACERVPVSGRRARLRAATAAPRFGPRVTSATLLLGRVVDAAGTRVEVRWQRVQSHGPARTREGKQMIKENAGAKATAYVLVVSSCRKAGEVSK